MERRLAVNATKQRWKNPGPSWGFAFLRYADQWVPRVIFRPALMLGTWVALAAMPAARRHSSRYLPVVLGRPASVIEVWHHFYAFIESLIVKLRVGRGVPHTCDLDDAQSADFQALVASDQPALFGTFHFGASDLLGYLLGRHSGRRIAMVRLQVGNSDDTRILGRLFGDWVSFIWVNNPADLLFALKSAIERGESLAMQCDRLQFSARTDVFRFLGKARIFPFTIYHLAVLFARPVAFCIGVPTGRDATRVFASPVFRPDAGASRDTNLERARVHFQQVLSQLETLVRQHPTLWFNFEALNPSPSDATRPSQR